MKLERLQQLTTKLHSAVIDLTKPRVIVTAPHAVCRNIEDVTGHL